MPAERSKKLKERLELARQINNWGTEMPPCSYCERNDRKCCVAESSTRCGECVRRGQKCDVEGPSLSDWASLEREEQRLQSEKTEALAKVMRLERQQQFLRQRGKDMLKRGLKTMDELDAAEEKERKDKEREERLQAEANAAALAFPLVPDGLLELPEF
jgi:hypothetical protein